MRMDSLRSSFSQPESASIVDSDSEGSKPPRSPAASASDIPVRTLKSLRAKPSRASRAETTEDSEGKQSLLESIPTVGENFDIISKIGEGTFSSVYLASWKGDRSWEFAIKHLVPTSSSTRLENEIWCLQEMGGRSHVISLHAYVRQEDHVALIMPYFKHDKFIDCLPLMGVAEVRCYMRALFEALQKIHSHGIIHRDIKPSNFLYNRAAQKFQLVDFGLAHSQTQTKESRGSILRGVRTKAQSSSAKKGTLTAAAPRGLAPPPATVAGSVTLPLRSVHSSRQLQRPTSRSLRQPLRMKARPVGASSAAGRSNSLSVSPALTSWGAAGGGGGGRGREASSPWACIRKHKDDFVCDMCMSRSNQVAPRAGTPGFRPPEVLLKYPQQSTAVDMWSSGIVLLCLLSKKYPFFKAHDDMSAMAQIVGLFGSKECSRAAKSYGKEFIASPESLPVDLKVLCTSLRSKALDNVSCDLHCKLATLLMASGDEEENENSDGNTSLLDHRFRESFCAGEEQRRPPKKRRKLYSNSKQSLQQNGNGTQQSECHSCSWNQVPDSAYDLLGRCLDLDPWSRLTAKQALQHPFLLNPLLVDAGAESAGELHLNHTPSASDSHTLASTIERPKR